MKVIGIVMGGYSAEYEVSIGSGNVVYQNLQSSGFEVYRLELNAKAWEALDDQDQRYPIHMDDFSFSLGERKITFDAIFNAIHGHPGEDGPLAGYFDMLHIPYTSSGQFASALTFNKAECNILLAHYGFRVPQSVFLHSEAISEEEIIAKLGLPCFVKPCRSGSSIGVSKVKTSAELGPAIQKAREIDHKVLVESMVTGLELACGVSDHEGKAKSLAVTHIEPSNDFFDYEAKYSGGSKEITPAAIPESTYESIMRNSEKVYELLELKGIARIDYILDADGNPVLIEVNTVPGLSEQSILPRQAKYIGLGLDQLFKASLEKVLNS